MGRKIFQNHFKFYFPRSHLFLVSMLDRYWRVNGRITNLAKVYYNLEGIDTEIKIERIITIF